MIAYEIDFQTTGHCTLGFPARRDGVDGFITNAHCSTRWGEVDNGRYWQPTRVFLQPWADRVGIETVDPPFFSHTGKPLRCRVGVERCRYSDANFARGEVPIARGTIARPRSYVFWDGSSIWRVTSEEIPSTDANRNIATKVGQRTGQSSGRIIDTCEKVRIRGTDITHLCQFLVRDMNYDFGDSGAAAFRVTDSPNTNDVAALGITWGFGHDAAGRVLVAVSPMDRVRSELGGNLLVCAPGFGC